MTKKLLLLVFFGVSVLHLTAQITKKNSPVKSQTTTPGNHSGMKWHLKTPVPAAANPFDLGPVQYKTLTTPIPNTTLEGVRLVHDKNGMPIFFEGKTVASVTLQPGDDYGAKAVEYAASLAPAGLRSPLEELKTQSVQVDEQGNTHVRLQQTWNGIPVFGAELIAHTREGAFSLLNGRYFPTPELQDATPALSEAQCRAIVYGHYGRAKVKTEWSSQELTLIGGESFKASLAVYHAGDQLDQEHLAYVVEFHPNPMKRVVYFVDAETGDILNTFDHTCSFNHHDECGMPTTDYRQPTTDNRQPTTDNRQPIADNPMPPVNGQGQDLFNINRTFGAWQQGSTYYLEDASKPMFNAGASNMPGDPVGVILTLNAQNKSSQNPTFDPVFITSNTATFNNKTAVSAHYNASVSYDYYRNTFNRNSINGQGGNIISLINVADSDGSSMGNAYWNGVAMFYGNGDQFFRELARGLDVAGHEMTHGVVEKTANLIYQNEPGALNESFADVFGAMIDRDDWLIGEDVMQPGVTPTGALRSMSDPHNGSSSNSPWWQPKNTSEQFTGTADNGGVHINSGIPNYAFYLFASNAAVGKDKAEQVYYKALRDYLVKSSQFIDCRIAVIQAAQDLYGQQVAQVAADAFTAVGILGSDPGGNYLGDLAPNPGADLVLVVSNNGQNLDLANGSGTILGTLYDGGVYSKPSVNDNGTQIVFVNQEGHVVYIELVYNMGNITPTVGILSDVPEWRNAAISKDVTGRYIAAIKETEEPYIFVFDFLGFVDQAFYLYNPTTSQGGQASFNVNYADVLEFDYSGEYIMYDANNQLSQNQTYWDISFLRFTENDQFTDPDNAFITKLFSVLPENTSVGNPTFAKNSPYVIAFDYIEEGATNRFDILAANTETGAIGTIQSDNGDLGWPSYNRLDNQIVYEGRVNPSSPLNIYRRSLAADKINSTGNESTFIADRNWANWFATGARSLMVGTVSPDDNPFGLSAAPNPASDQTTISFRAQSDMDVQVDLVDPLGRVAFSQNWRAAAGENRFDINLNGLPSGAYVIRLTGGSAVSTMQVVKF